MLLLRNDRLCWGALLGLDISILSSWFAVVLNLMSYDVPWSYSGNSLNLFFEVDIIRPGRDVFVLLGCGILLHIALRI